MWNLGWIKGPKGINNQSVKCFVKFFVPWPYPAYPETSLTLGTPRDIPIAQYTAYSPERPPYSPETAPTVSPAYPAYPKLQAEHTHGTQHTQPTRRPQGPDYKTTRLQILPANREHNAQRRQNTEKALDGKYRENSPEEANQRKSLAEPSTTHHQQKGSLSCECK